MQVYFDTSAFDHLQKRIGCTAADVARLRQAVYGGMVSIPLSLHVLEELLLARRSSPQTYSALLRTILSIAPARTIVKPCADIIRDDLRSFAAGRGAENPLLHGPVQNIVAAGIATLIESDGEDWEDEFVQVLKQVRSNREGFVERTRQIPEFAEKPRYKKGERPTFEAMWLAGANDRPRYWADQVGVGDRCADRGIDRLLELKSVRMAAGISLSCAYGLLFEGAGIGESDMAGQHHAVSAAAVATTLVTADVRLLKLVSRVSLRDFEACNLRGFLDRLPA